MTARARALYRRLLRQISSLPEPTRPYYRAHLREGFVAFGDETDEARLAQIEARAAQDAAWVLKKYADTTTSPPRSWP